MSDELTLAELDRDGAVLEGVAELAGDSRADFLRKAVIGGGVLLGGGALLGGLADEARGATSANDVAILNFALTLEYLEDAFYAEAVARRRLNGETARFAQVVARHERAHVEALKGALGRKAVKKPPAQLQGNHHQPELVPGDRSDARGRRVPPRTSARSGTSRASRSWPPRARS